MEEWPQKRLNFDTTGRKQRWKSDLRSVLTLTQRAVSSGGRVTSEVSNFDTMGFFFLPFTQDVIESHLKFLHYTAWSKGILIMAYSNSHTYACIYIYGSSSAIPTFQHKETNRGLITAHISSSSWGTGLKLGQSSAWTRIMEATKMGPSMFVSFTIGTFLFWFLEEG